MSAPRLLPCLDVDPRGVVKGVRFQDLQVVGDPVSLATAYAQEGADEIVLLEVSATQRGDEPAHALVRRLAQRLRVPLTVGGGIRSLDDAARLFDAGADRVSVNTAALERPALVEELAYRYGSQAVVVAVDYLPQPQAGWPVRSHAGTRDTGRRLGEWLREAQERGAGEFLLTAMGRDGTGLGYDLHALEAARTHTVRPLIASGGAGSPDHVAQVFQRGLADAALLASRLHQGAFTLTQLRAWLAERGVAVRRDSYLPLHLPA